MLTAQLLQKKMICSLFQNQCLKVIAMTHETKIWKFKKGLFKVSYINNKTIFQIWFSPLFNMMLKDKIN